MIEFKYRPEVDGLRAGAVIMVLLFHMGLGFTGGFVGVDVFFVISGFLITSLILKEQQRGDFSLSNFWIRRVRRIIPAATCVVIVTLSVGAIFLLPTDFAELARSAIAQQLMAANMFFLQNTNYFSESAELKPLLHTWSLAVEEQFYLFYPLLLIVGRRLSQRNLVGVLVGLAVVSFALSEWGVRSDPTTTFYVLPTCAWEMLLGGVLVFVPLPSKHVVWRSNVLGWTGILAILGSGWCFDSSTRFPGSAALLPCLGTALIIYSNSRKLNGLGKLLAWKPVVFVGLISYSLYLWHWPLLAYSRYWLGDSLSLSTRLLALASSFVLAYLSWRYVETPFRRTGRSKSVAMKSQTPFRAAALSTMAVLTICLVVVQGKGISGRFPDEVLQYDVRNLGREHENFHCVADDVRAGRLPFIGNAAPTTDKVDCLIWGDSHAMVAATGADSLTRKYGLSCPVAATVGITPLLDVWRPVLRKDSIEWNEAVFEFIKKHRIKNVILISRWAAYIEGRSNGAIDTLIADDRSRNVSRAESKEAFRRGLNSTIQQLEELNVRVWIVKQVPFQCGNPNKRMATAALIGHNRPLGVSAEQHSSRQANANQVLELFAGERVTVLDPAPFCFDADGNSRLGDVDGSYYFDDDHLSRHGAERLLSELIEGVFAEIAKQKQSRSITSI